MAKKIDILIVGAGASGLMAALELSKAGKKVQVLEARDRIGGRIFTVHDFFSQPEEAGAEFIHGDLPLTLDLLRQAGIGTYLMQGIFWQANQNGNTTSEPFSDHGHLLSQRLLEVKEDMPLTEFLEKNFGEEKYTGLRESIRGFAEGYDAANPDKFSTIAFRDEWMNDDDWSQQRVEGGYSTLMDWMAKQVQKNGGKIVLNSVVKEIHWSKDEVEVTVSSGEKFSAEKIIVTVPLGVLVLNENEEDAISFSPSIEDRIEAAKRMGYGEVIKILLEFSESFWSQEKLKERLRLELPPLSFIMSNQRVPTWWTQYPRDTNLLTGWLAGPRAEKMKTLSEEMLLEDCLQSLSAIFQMNVGDLKSKLIASKIYNWSTDPFTRGAYAYSTVHSSDAKNLLNTPIDDTIYFSGEALDDGPSMGTVEAAFRSGQSVAKRVIDQ